MRTILLGLGLVAALAQPALADWQRQGQATGPRGNSLQSESRGSCNSGRCEWSRETEGPRGNSASTAGSATRTAPGQWSSSSTTTGSGGRTIKRDGTLQVSR